jgi:bifunctional oligoribonuclease and PAP phosphatase NrnA
MKPVQETYTLLHQPQQVVITTHQKPDGDAMGSSLGLYNFLTSLGHNVTVISPTNWADFLSWMPGADKVIDFEKKRELCYRLIGEADLVFCLDFNVLHRTKNMEKSLGETKATRILIDHHEQPQVAMFSYGISNVQKSSTCEMVYDYITASPFADKLNVDIAACLYAGIMTDTGSFRFPSTSASVHRAIAHFKDLGLEHSKIHENIYDNFLENRLRFLGDALLHKLTVLYEYNTAYMAIPHGDIIKYNIKTGDTEGLVNYLLTIKGVKFGALVIDREEERRWSFRSKGDFDANTFARTHFEGGGHHNAAGGRSSESLAQTVRKFLQTIPQYKEQLQ